MYQRESSSNWLLFGAAILGIPALLIFILAFMLGSNFKEAGWLNPEIASQQAAQMQAETTLLSEQGQLDLELRRAQVEQQKLQMQREVEHQDIQRKQEIALQAKRAAVVDDLIWFAGWTMIGCIGILVLTLCLALLKRAFTPPAGPAALYTLPGREPRRWAALPSHGTAAPPRREEQVVMGKGVPGEDK